ncbi:MAG: hypothetical protein AAGI11_12235 [Pseudomonadota bacterium]
MTELWHKYFIFVKRAERVHITMPRQRRLRAGSGNHICRFARALLIVLTITTAGACDKSSPLSQRVSEPFLNAEILQLLAHAVRSWQSGQASSLELSWPEQAPGPSLVYVALWADGKRVARNWYDHPDRNTALQSAINGALTSLHSVAPMDLSYVEISIGYGLRNLDAGQLGDDFSAIHRGARGLEVRHEDRIVRYAPSQMIAHNLSFERALEGIAGSLDLGGQQLIDESALATFEAHQVIIDLKAPTSATGMHRGQAIVPYQAMNQATVGDLASGMAAWMYRNIGPDGRMTYMYYPASARESNGNNMIRQWMASLALVRLAKLDGRPEKVAAATRNITYNLNQFYLEENGLGLIEYRDKVKLGAIALAALAMVEHPDNEMFRPQIDKLVEATDHLWREDGSFQTFYRPAERSGEPALYNFYPGETLLLWATLLQQQPDADRAARFDKSMQYYRDWHLSNRKPSFIPWHTQAYYLRWQITGDTRYRDWIFDMNDWLLDMQRNSFQVYEDTRGRFYNPLRPEFGPPHASSTGVYLEGLIDAYSLAVEHGDTARARRYRQSINGGLRSLRQLQFNEGPEAWFVKDPERVFGGIRTTVFNNVIRVDNVQHGLLGVLKIQDHFSPEDYRDYPVN